MFCIHLAFDEHVIDRDFYISPDFLAKHLVYQPLIYGPSILQSKGHYLVVIESLACDERHFLLVFFTYANLIVS